MQSTQLPKSGPWHEGTAVVRSASRPCTDGGRTNLHKWREEQILNDAASHMLDTLEDWTECNRDCARLAANCVELQG